MPSPTSVDAVRALVADVLDEPASMIGDHDDLLELGLDSIRLMAITEYFRGQGSTVALMDLVDTPTVVAWTHLVNESLTSSHAETGS